MSNKQWGTKLENIEGFIRILLSQAQEKPLTFMQNVGPEYRPGNDTEPLGKPFKFFSTGTELSCFRCGKSRHFQNNCE